jgi:hypothetical protein
VLLFVLSGIFLVGSIIATVNDEFKKRQEKQELSTKLDTLNGGNNFCHVEFDAGPDPYGASSILLHVINEGDYPAYDVVVQIVDVLDADRIKASVPENEAPYAVLQRMFQKTIGTVAPKSGVSLTKNLLRLPDTEVAVYEIHLQQRNGTVSQVVRFERVNGSWTFATKATLLDDTKVLWQQIHSRYPRQNIDNSNWWRGF